MNKTFNNDEMQKIASETIEALTNNISASEDPELFVTERLIKAAAEVAFLNYVSSITDSDEGIIPVFNYHYGQILSGMKNNINQKAIN